MPQGNSNNIRLQLANQYPYLAQASGFATGGDSSNPIEQILANSYSNSQGFSPVANVGAIGSDNKSLANNTSDAVQNIFALLRGASVDATNRAKEAAAKRAAEEANAKAVAMQAKILEAQKKAALTALKSLPSGSGSSGISQPQGNYNLVKPPPLKMPATIPELNLPNTPYLDAHGGDKVPLPTANGGNKNTKPYDPNKTGPQIAPPSKKKVAKRDPRKPGIQN